MRVAWRRAEFEPSIRSPNPTLPVARGALSSSNPTDRPMPAMTAVGATMQPRPTALEVRPKVNGAVGDTEPAPRRRRTLA